MRPSDIMPLMMTNELLRLYRLSPDWVEWIPLEGNEYSLRSKFPTWLSKLWQSGSCAFSNKAFSHWLGGGPKVFKPTKEQCLALEQVDVNLTMQDYTQPYPALLVELDYPPFHGVLCYREERIIACTLLSKDHLNDITTTVSNIYNTGEFIEKSLERFDEDCKEHHEQATKALRVACNSCLALSHFGDHLSYLFPKEVERDRAYAREQSERGKAARQRLSLAIQVTSFSQEVTLHKTSKTTREPGEPTGRLMPAHWRRGHWAMVACGPKHSLRKRAFRAPCMIHAELFVGELASTETTYTAP